MNEISNLHLLGTSECLLGSIQDFSAALKVARGD